jgi:hypothetical protein
LPFVFEKTFNSQTLFNTLFLKLTQFRISATLKAFGKHENYRVP